MTLCFVFLIFGCFFLFLVFSGIQLSGSQLKDRYRNIEKTHGDGDYKNYQNAGTKNTYKPSWFADYYDPKY